MEWVGLHAALLGGLDSAVSLASGSEARIAGRFAFYREFRGDTVLPLPLHPLLTSCL